MSKDKQLPLETLSRHRSEIKIYREALNDLNKEVACLKQNNMWLEFKLLRKKESPMRLAGFLILLQLLLFIY